MMLLSSSLFSPADAQTSVHIIFPPSLFLLSSPKLPSTLTFSLILEQLFCSKLEDVIQLLLGHGARLGSEARPDHQVSQHHLLLGNLERAEQVRREGSFIRATSQDFNSVGLCFYLPE